MNECKISTAGDTAAIGLLTPKRAYAIDVLRGMAILFMVLSSWEPFGSLPAWMYHAQTPPPTHDWNPNIPGITWVDLIFPFFIFSMGAAFPFAMSKRLDAGMSIAAASFASVKRWLWLIGFAVYVPHIRPNMFGENPGNGAMVLGILMFFLMFAIWGRFPWKMNKKTEAAIKITGIAAAAAVFAKMNYRGNTSFSIFSNNIILFVLADLSVFGSVIWLLTRKNQMLRLGLLGVFMAIRVSSQVEESWLATFASTTQIPWLASVIKSSLAQEYHRYVRWSYDFSWILSWRVLKYLFIIVPATVVGDIIFAWMNKPRSADAAESFSRLRCLSVAMLSFSFILLCLVGLMSRYIFATLAAASLMCMIGLWLVRNPLSDLEILVATLFKWASFWVLLGLLFEPYEGGIKKDPSTMSYYFVTVGLATFTVIGTTILIEMFNAKKYLQLFIYNGQNPMIAYVSGPNILYPLLMLTGLMKYRDSFSIANPWPGFVLSVGLVLLVGLWVMLFSKMKIFLRT